jgi:hypothetical protein
MNGRIPLPPRRRLAIVISMKFLFKIFPILKIND